MYIDLDVCVPQWMRDNFSKGMYPTLQQRADFTSDACDYVRGEIDSKSTKRSDLTVIISFSFVNDDIRVIFRDAFPHAEWILVDTPENLATERIAAREGHFYKNASDDQGRGAPGEDSDDSNSDWEFRPVDFPHTLLDGRHAVEMNAKKVVECIQRQNSAGRPG
ncbi:hypothetical protein ACHAWF_007163 [Thalassiosira exigua]